MVGLWHWVYTSSLQMSTVIGVPTRHLRQWSTLIHSAWQAQREISRWTCTMLGVSSSCFRTWNIFSNVPLFSNVFHLVFERSPCCIGIDFGVLICADFGRRNHTRALFVTLPFSFRLRSPLHALRKTWKGKSCWTGFEIDFRWSRSWWSCSGPKVIFRPEGPGKDQTRGCRLWWMNFHPCSSIFQIFWKIWFPCWVQDLPRKPGIARNQLRAGWRVQWPHITIEGDEGFNADINGESPDTLLTHLHS